MHGPSIYSKKKKKKEEEKKKEKGNSNIFWEVTFKVYEFSLNIK